MFVRFCKSSNLIDSLCQKQKHAFNHAPVAKKTQKMAQAIAIKASDWTQQWCEARFLEPSDIQDSKLADLAFRWWNNRPYKREILASNYVNKARESTLQVASSTARTAPTKASQPCTAAEASYLPHLKTRNVQLIFKWRLDEVCATRKLAQSSKLTLLNWVE